MNGSSNQTPGLQWKWVFIGVAVGVGIAATSILVVLPTFHATPIQALVLLAGFIATGAIVGYASPGVTIKEASVAGGLVALLTMIILYVSGAKLGQDMMRNLLLVVLGFGLSWIGAWVGEKLQGSGGHSEEETKRLFTDVQAKWVIVGVVLGFALNVLAVFILTPIFNLRLDVAFGAFLFSLTVTGFIVAYKSPGVTLKEPAIAGFLAFTQSAAHEVAFVSDKNDAAGLVSQAPAFFNFFWTKRQQTAIVPRHFHGRHFPARREIVMHARGQRERFVVEFR